MRSPLLLSLCLCLVSASATAQIYTWKDAQGQTHYADTPPPNQDAKAPRAVNTAPAVSTSGSAPAAAKSSTKPQTWADKDLEYRQRKAAEAQSAAAKEKEAAAKTQNAEYCASLTRNIALFDRGGRITKPDAKGEPVYLSSEQIKAEGDALRDRYAKDCSK